MNESQNKQSVELTTKGKIILGVLAVVIIGVIITIVVINNNKNANGKKELAESTLAITVTPDKESGTSMVLSPGNNTTSGISVGGTAVLSYTFDKDINEEVRWVISDTSVATEDNGVLTGLKAGTVEIYAVAVDNEDVKSNTVTLKVTR